VTTADKAKGEFISSISHELRTPIHGILASAEFLAESSLDLYQRGFVDTIVSCGRTLLDTINHVLDFQKLNSLSDHAVEEKLKSGAGLENAATAKIETDLSALVQDIMEGVCLGSQFQSNASCTRTETLVTREIGSRITVIVDIQHREDGWVFLTHPAALKRVISNLAGNAVKYTEAGWVRIRLRTEDMEPDVQGNKRARMILSVSDSGKGISREFLKTKLFTPFSQVCLTVLPRSPHMFLTLCRRTRSPPAQAWGCR
jgi:signal transduction histidine kinase